MTPETAVPHAPAGATAPKDFKAAVDIQVRFRDTDAMGHVNNAVYLSYLEVARMHYWRLLTGQDGFKRLTFIVARVEIDYRSPVVITETVRAWIRVPEMRRSSFVTQYVLEEAATRRRVAEARAVQVCYDYKEKKVRRMDAEMKDLILTFEAPAEVAS
ncbi:MAG: acyl-CoA thioesterase [Elusimicrobia bacterium]|nr:acyl-CoA thioesterase [Elusimicrobiota bacterium]